MITVRMLAVASAATAIVWSQDEASLRRFFEGKSVRVKLDLPGTHQGVDIRWRQDPPLDFKTYSQRLKNFGRALAEGESTRVTTVRVKGKNIEFQLGGGGYGTLGDDTGTVTARSVPKSSREKDLEDRIRNESDPRRRDDMKRELDRLQNDRRREESRERARAAELEQIKKTEIAGKRREGGSRFNIWFPENYLAEHVPTPEELMAILGEWVDFGGPAVTPSPVPSGPVRKGMTRDEVYGTLGRPQRTSTRAEGSLQMKTDVWELRDQVIEVDFLEDVVVRFRSSSR